jgi:hypothetical protein
MIGHFAAPAFPAEKTMLPVVASFSPISGLSQLRVNIWEPPRLARRASPLGSAAAF